VPVFIVNQMNQIWLITILLWTKNQGAVRLGYSISERQWGAERCCKASRASGLTDKARPTVHQSTVSSQYSDTKKKGNS